MSHTALTYHIVISTYCRHKTISAEYERELYKFIFDFANKRDVLIRRIGGMEDHIHILCDIPAKYSLADFVRLLKSESSKFLRYSAHFPLWEKWAEGYGAFTVDASLREARRQYIANQKIHHTKKSFADEYREFLNEVGISDDNLFSNE